MSKPIETQKKIVPICGRERNSGHTHAGLTKRQPHENWSVRLWAAMTEHWSSRKNNEQPLSSNQPWFWSPSFPPSCLEPGRPREGAEEWKSRPHSSGLAGQKASLWAQVGVTGGVGGGGSSYKVFLHCFLSFHWELLQPAVDLGLLQAPEIY